MKERPNILLLVGEDTGYHLGCCGDSTATTPNLDRLASEGTLYTCAISTAPVCAPSRSSLVMGKYSFSAGSHHMRSTLLSPPRLFTHELRDAGYYVNWANKTDFNFQPPDDFADECNEWFEPLASGNLPDKPLFLYHNFGITHESTMWKDKWADAVAPRLGDGEKHRPEKVRVPAYLPDVPEVRADIARYYDSLLLQDREVGQALDALEKSGMADNTIVIYMTDHGRGLAREKRWCYEAGIHLPLIVRWPEHLKPGTTDNQVVDWTDIAPTILAMAGVEIPEDYQGRVFVGPGAESKPRRFAFSGRDRMDEAFDRVRVVRDQKYHYIRNFFPQLPYAQRVGYMERQDTTRVLREMQAEGRLSEAQALWLQEKKPSQELYDIERDPDCVNNLANHPSHQTVVETMDKALEEFLTKIRDKAEFSERELIDQGLVQDRLEEYGDRIEPLPEKFRIGPERTVLERPS